MALKELLVAAGDHRKIRYTADSSYVMRGVQKLRRGKRPRTHIDLWGEDLSMGCHAWGRPTKPANNSCVKTVLTMFVLLTL